MKKKTSRLIALDRKYVWHPFTQMKEWTATDPLIIERAQGNYLIDTEGRRYLDMLAGKPVFRGVQADLDRLSKEQQDALRSILHRIEQEQIAAIRASLAKPPS